MNIQSLLLLLSILAVFGIVLIRYVRRQRRHPGCGCGYNCSCNACDSLNIFH